MSTDKVICDECGWHGGARQLLRATNPFDRDNDIYGCPSCLTASGLLYACEFKDCWNKVTCGTPVPGGYAQTCGKHAPEVLPEKRL